MVPTSNKKKKVYVTMVADLFHYGHVVFLRRARDFGDYLVVGVLTDELAATYKRVPILNAEERMRVVESCRYVDEVRLHDRLLNNEWLQENGFAARVYAVGGTDDLIRRQTRKNDFLPEYRIKVPYEPGISTTGIIERIRSRDAC
ncbi:MAG: glycerol-3-phosphate cytidylyltransferase [marine bacterium B5-7]|nr:MAG: glycerol-3-phosphate cytidylyltransferase [marine bacterium B5-7]